MNMKETNLVTTNPEIAKEWDYLKNGDLKPTDVTAKSDKKVWWTCPKGHSYVASVNARTHGSGCPFCAGKKVLPGVNDLAVTNPELTKEWDYSKNGDLRPSDVTAGSNKKVWWTCPDGHSYSATVNARVKGKGCPFCASK